MIYADQKCENEESFASNQISINWDYQIKNACKKAAEKKKATKLNCI